MEPYAFGIDIGGTAVKIGLFQTDGTLLEKWQLPTRTEEKGARILPDALDSIRAVMARRSMLWNEVEGIGMGVPGPVNDEGTVFRCVNLGWDVFNVPEKMRELEPCLHRVKVSNDVNAAALGELWKGGAKGYHSAFLVTLGTGIGGGLSHAGDVLLNKVESYYRKYAFHAFQDTEFVLAELGNDAGIYGCVKMLLQEE